jgi:hypothetical protein
MLGGGRVGAWQLRGRTSVMPGGHSSPGWIWVPALPRPGPPWAMADPVTATKASAREQVVVAIARAMRIETWVLLGMS